MSAWSHLPNAHHIDWAIKSMKDRPDVWSAARVAVLNADRDVSLGAAWGAAFDAAWRAARGAARDAAWDAAFDAARDAARDAVWDAAWGAILALIAWDDCDKYLNMTYEQLKVYAILSERPQAILLLPMKWVQENEQMDLHRECA